MKETEGKFYHTKESVEQYIKIAEGYDGKELIDKITEISSTIIQLYSNLAQDLEQT